MEEVWDQIGRRLREAREAADLTADDIVFRTRIPKSVVEALEAENFSVFTSPTYAKSFLRQYSEYLGVDAEPWLDALEPASYVGGEAWQPMFSGGEPEHPVAKRPVRDPRRNEQEFTTKRNQWSAAWLMVVTAGLVIGVVKGYHFLEQKFGHEAPVEKAQVTDKEVADQSGTQVKEAEASGQEQVSTTSPREADASQTATAVVAQEDSNGRPPRAVIVRE